MYVYIYIYLYVCIYIYIHSVRPRLLTAPEGGAHVPSS